MKEIQLPNEPFRRAYKTSKGRKDYLCYCCLTNIPKGVKSFVIYLHPGTSRACNQCVTIMED